MSHFNEYGVINGIWIEDVAFDDDIVVYHVLDDGVNTNDIAANINTENGSSQPPKDPPFPPLDEFHEVHRQVMEALDRGDALHEEAKATHEVGNEDEGANDTMDGLEELYAQATTAVYLG